MSHTCTWWRDILLRAPEFWTVVDGRSPRRLRVFMDRSKPLPMSLFIPTQTPDFSIVLQHVMPRLECLDIFVHRAFPYHPDQDFDIQPLLRRIRAPDLHCLTVTNEGHGGAPQSASSVTDPILFDQLECGLRALALDVTFWLPRNSFPFLTHLHLTHHKYSDTSLTWFKYPETYLTHSDMLKVVEHAPALRHLHLIGFCCFADGLRDDARIVRNHLRSVNFDRCTWHAPHFIMQYLHVPADAPLVVQVTDLQDMGAPYSPIVPPPSPFPCTMGFTHMDLLVVDDSAFLLATSSPAPAREFLVKGQIPSRSAEFFSIVPDVLSLTAVTSLHIGMPLYDMNASSARFVAIFRELVYLEDLRLYLGPPTGLPTFIEAISGVLSMPAGPPLPLPFCPRLAVVGVEIDLAVRGSYWNPDMDGEGVVPLAEMVVARAAMGYALRRLVVAYEPSSQPEFDSYLRAFADAFEVCRGHVAEMTVMESDEGNRELLTTLNNPQIHPSPTRPHCSRPTANVAGMGRSSVTNRDRLSEGC
ncbi:hypothetical protein C8Q80DRAFT_1122566 [Daedaleopsis nitida]|nr:hypothetical protein C8Q80DRAFT_1122566 [Daedaleopsis nitida]